MSTRTDVFPRRSLLETGVRIISRKNLRTYAARHPLTRPSLTYFEQVARRSRWQTPEEVRRSFPTAHIINGIRLRFEIQWNVHRMICSFDFRRGIVYVKFLGTHREYDDANAVEVAIF